MFLCSTATVVVGPATTSVPLHQVGGKRAEAPTPGTTRRDSHLRLPVYLDGTHALLEPNSTKLPLPLVLPCCTVAGAWVLLGLGRMSWPPPGRSVLLRAEAILTMAATVIAGMLAFLQVRKD